MKRLSIKLKLILNIFEADISKCRCRGGIFFLLIFHFVTFFLEVPLMAFTDHFLPFFLQDEVCHLAKGLLETSEILFVQIDLVLLVVKGTIIMGEFFALGDGEIVIICFCSSYIKEVGPSSSSQHFCKNLFFLNRFIVAHSQNIFYGLKFLSLKNLKKINVPQLIFTFLFHLIVLDKALCSNLPY